MNPSDLRVRKIGLLVRDLNKQLKMAADQKIEVDLKIEDKTRSFDKVKRIEVKLLKQEQMQKE